MFPWSKRHVVSFTKSLKNSPTEMPSRSSGASFPVAGKRRKRQVTFADDTSSERRELTSRLRNQPLDSEVVEDTSMPQSMGASGGHAGEKFAVPPVPLGVVASGAAILI